MRRIEPCGPGGHAFERTAPRINDLRFHVVAVAQDTAQQPLTSRDIRDETHAPGEALPEERCDRVEPPVVTVTTHLLSHRSHRSCAATPRFCARARYQRRHTSECGVSAVRLFE